MRRDKRGIARCDNRRCSSYAPPSTTDRKAHAYGQMFKRRADEK
jgi:hypothetical protein